MNFVYAEPNEKYPIVRVQSATWEVGLYPVLFGVRVAANPLGAGGYALDYCAGADPLMQVELFTLLVQILSRYPDTLRYDEAHRLFPRWTRRPMVNDPECLAALRALAVSEEPLCA